MSNDQCRRCQYYRQHYTLDERKFFRVYCGHCTFGRTKRKQPDAKACEHYIPCPSQEDAFVSKEYLSKKLLQYMLDLELLPEINDKEGSV